MEPETLRQVRGGVELAADAVEATVRATARAHAAVARGVYAPFALLGPLAVPAQVVEQIQATIAGQVYQSILAANRLVSGAALALLKRDAAESERGPLAAQPCVPRPAERLGAFASPRPGEDV